MSWINHILPKIKREEESRKPSPIPEGVWTKCPGCEQALYTEELERSLRVCPKCGHHFRLGARTRLLSFLDPDTAVEIGADVRPMIRSSSSTASRIRSASLTRAPKWAKPMPSS